MKLDVFTNNEKFATDKETKEVIINDTILMRIRGSHEGATLRIKEDSFKNLPDSWDKHDGIAIEVHGTPRISESGDYYSFPSAEVVEIDGQLQYFKGAGMKEKEVSIEEAMKALMGTK